MATAFSRAPTGATATTVDDVAAATAEDWYAFASKTDISTPIADYIAVEPRGMSNPPRNPKVRAMLLRDLQEYAIVTSPGAGSRCSTWPPTPVPASSVPHWMTGSVREKARMGMTYSPSAPAVMNADTCTSWRPSPASKRRQPKLSPEQRRAVSLAAAERRKVAKRAFSTHLEKVTPEFDISLERSEENEHMKLGLVDVGGLLVAKPEPGTLVHQWNSENPEELVSSGDRVVEVNEVRDLAGMIDEIREAEVLDIKLQKGWGQMGDTSQLHHGSSAARWRPRKVCVDQSSLWGAGEPTPSKDTKGQPSPKSSAEGKSKDQQTEESPGFQLPGRLRSERFISDHEVQQAREILRGQSGLHVSAKADRYALSLDMTRGFHAPMCTTGSGVATGIPAAKWAADGSYLNRFHNAAIRKEHPSPLQPLKATISLSVSTGTLQGKKKKKGPNSNDDEDDMELNDLGNIQPKYPVDDSLKAMRKLKKKHFPEDTAAEEERLRQIRYEKQLKRQAKKEAMADFAATGALGIGKTKTDENAYAA